MSLPRGKIRPRRDLNVLNQQDLINKNLSLGLITWHGPITIMRFQLQAPNGLM